MDGQPNVEPRHCTGTSLAILCSHGTCCTLHCGIPEPQTCLYRCTCSGAVRAESTQEPTEYSLTLRKPVGIVFAQKPSGGPGEPSSWDVTVLGCFDACMHSCSEICTTFKTVSIEVHSIYAV